MEGYFYGRNERYYNIYKEEHKEALDREAV